MLNYVGDGGSEKYVMDLMLSLGAERCILVYSDKGPGLKAFEDLNVTMYQVKMKHPFDVSAARQLKQIINKENVEVVHAQFLRENYIGAIAKVLGAKVKLIWTYHVDVPMSLPVRFLNSLVTRLNHTVIAVSDFMKKSLERKGVSSNKIKLIYNGIDCGDFSKDKKVNSIAIISIIGRLREEKGHLFLLDSLAILQDKHPEYQWICHMFGEGPDKEKIEQKIEALGFQSKVILKGFSTNKEEMLHESDIIVVPSRNEALSYVAIEALAYGTPAIVTDVGGLPEVVKDKETGFVVDYGNKDKLAEQIGVLLSDEVLYRQFAQNGKEHFNRHFTLKKMIEETEKVYRD
ncbi:glycosyltransferase family 4 protein [Bacillus tianshenii]|uniref:glycosyltransferase family 4 protein n=1 Tax=Sutcliffiella tianshenii TaxID=1463404 RepID=UPI001CD5B78B|nr:glycosyltransferase family 4 protein [Bacillus tianshenii]MCA1320489.1 glycosyltransferase family 4 protein [Bacillus tianshenii]